MTKNKILVVDDNAINLKLLTRTLEHAGYEVINAENGETACQLLLNNTPDLVLLDIMMPVMDGYSVCEWMKSNRNIADIPVIFLTAKTDAVDKVKGLELGAVDYITKPFDSVEVIARVKTHLGLQNLRRQLMEKNQQLEKANNELYQKNEKINNDIKAAGAVQRQLLPSISNEISNINVSWKFVPSSHIAGDIFNIIPIDEQHVALYIIDVSGHGVQAAMLAVLIHNFFRMGTDNRPIKEKIGKQLEISHLLEPWHVAKALNAYFQMEKFDAYFTCVYGILNLKTLIFKFINAGHPFPFVLHKNNQIDFLEHADIPIGILPETSHTEKTYHLVTGDRLVFYTDGIYEPVVKDGGKLDKEKMADLINTAEGDLNSRFDFAIDNILKLTQKNTFNDDVSLFGIDIK